VDLIHFKSHRQVQIAAPKIKSKESPRPRFASSKFSESFFKMDADLHRTIDTCPILCENVYSRTDWSRNMRILLADDDTRVGKHIREALIAEGYAVDYAQDGDEAHWLAENNAYDAIVLDVMMPLRDGFTIARSLRRKGNQTPVLFLTAKGEIEDKVRGLDVGGDDYMIKPFSVVELLARLRALLRRQRPQASNLLRFEDLELDLVAHQARRADKTIELTNREFSLLELLMMTAPRPVSKAVIIERVWNQYFDSQTNVVNVYVNHLRSKIDLPGLVPIVQTVRGIGFALRKADP
jgi:two-component system, OmpR family, copper resistance phosphate regulon response regulator CusR